MEYGMLLKIIYYNITILGGLIMRG